MDSAIAITNKPLENWTALAQSARYDARELAQILGLSSRQLQRKFQINIGLPPQQWLNERRIFAAQELLIRGRPVKEVAFQLGFKQVSHFCREFKRITKVTPSQFANLPFHVELSLADNKCRNQIIPTT